MQSLERAMLTLRAVAKLGPHGVRLADVAQETGLSKSTAHRFLVALAQLNLLDQNEDSGLYYLGMDLAHLGAVAGNRFNLRDLALPAMERLVELTGDTVYMSILRAYDAVCVSRLEGDYPIKTLTLHVGDQRPLGIGAGSLAILSFQSDEFVEKAVTANTERIENQWGIQATELFKFVEATRKTGIALNPGRVAPGMTALGAPIFDASGKAIAALGVGAITTRMDEERRAQIGLWLQEEAKNVQEQLIRLLGTPNMHDLKRLAERN